MEGAKKKCRCSDKGHQAGVQKNIKLCFQNLKKPLSWAYYWCFIVVRTFF